MGDKTEVVLYAIRGVSGDDNLVGPAIPVQMNNNFEIEVAATSYMLNDNNIPIAEHTNSNTNFFTSASRSVTTNSSFLNNYFYKGGHIVINVTSITDTPSVVPVLQGWEKFDGSTYYDILRGNPITTTGITILKIFPGITPVPNLSANDILPHVSRLRMEHADTDAITYTAFISLIK